MGIWAEIFKLAKIGSARAAETAGPSLQRAGSLADEAGAAVGEAQGTLSRREMIKIGKEAALETRAASRPGFLRRPAASEMNLTTSARRAIAEEVGKRGMTDISEATIDGLAIRAGKKAMSGGTAKSAFKTTGAVALGTGKFALSHPFLTAAGLGSIAYALSDKNLSEFIPSLSSIVPDSVEPFLNVATGDFGGVVDKGLDLAEKGFDGVSGIFNMASDGLEYLGLDPDYAYYATLIGTAWALKTLIDKTHIGEILPAGGLVTLIAAGVIAYQIAKNAAENDVPAPAMEVAGVDPALTRSAQPALAPVPM